MINVTFEIGGRQVTPHRVGKELEKVFLKHMIDNITKALSSVRCSEHGQHPKVIVKGPTMNKLNFEVHGCCQDLINLAISKLK